MKSYAYVLIAAAILIAAFSIWYFAGDNSMGNDMGSQDSSASAGSSSAVATGTTSQVDIKSYAFSPQSLTIKPGTTVTWTNSDSVPHTVTANDKSFDSGTLNSGGAYAFTFTEPGTYTYYCQIHPSMKGTIIVQ
jgi:plastocyanin